MKITIAQKLIPFSHVPGTACVIPGSEWEIQVFPALFKFKSLISGEEKSVPVAMQGPVLDFTVQLNLEKLRVEISGHTAHGYRRYCVSREEGGIVIFYEKEKRKEILPLFCAKGSKSKERLSLGMHKKLDWQLVVRRRDLKEIFPVWLRLGQITPETPLTDEGTASLLKECSKLEVVSCFTKLFLAGFKSLLVPRLVDDEYQGIVACPSTAKSSPLTLLTQGAVLIRSLFFKEEGNLLHFLPELSPEFHEGRFVQIVTQVGDCISLEWTKKLLAKVEILPKQTREITLCLQKNLKSFRVRGSLKEKGKRQSVTSSLRVEEGRALYLDRFEK